jgi:hypothetical protein
MASFGELWAEGVQSWFHCNTGGLGVKVDGKRKAILTRAERKKHCPELSAMMEDVFKGNDWTYTTTDKRLDQPHLKGYDHSRAPVFKWPQKVLDDFRKEEERRRKKKARK